MEEENIQQNAVDFDPTDTLPTLETVKIVQKSSFLEPKTVKIVRPKINRFGKPALVIQGETDDLCGQITIKNNTWNELKKSFGPTPDLWAGKLIQISATKFEGNENVSAGYSIEIKTSS